MPGHGDCLPPRGRNREWTRPGEAGKLEEGWAQAKVLVEMGGRLQGLAPSSTPGSGLTSSHLASVTSLSTGQGQGTGSSHGW